MWKRKFTKGIYSVNIIGGKRDRGINNEGKENTAPGNIM